MLNVSNISRGVYVKETKRDTGILYVQWLRLFSSFDCYWNFAEMIEFYAPGKVIDISCCIVALNFVYIKSKTASNFVHIKWLGCSVLGTRVVALLLGVFLQIQ